MVNADCVLSKKVLVAEAPKSRSSGDDSGSSGQGEVQEIAMPLPNVTKKSIDEREKRAVMLAKESFKHINQKVSGVQWSGVQWSGIQTLNAGGFDIECGFLLCIYSYALVLIALCFVFDFVFSIYSILIELKRTSTNENHSLS